MPFSTMSRRAFSMRASRSSSEIGTMPSVIDVSGFCAKSDPGPVSPLSNVKPAEA
jgi:hypothetical protein